MMKTAQAYFYSFLLVFIFSSCHQKVERKAQIDKLFSIAEFMNSEMDSLHAHQAQMMKTGWVNGVADSTLIEQPNWNNEWQLFIRADISRPALRSAYQIDSQRIDPESLRVLYTAIGEKPVVRSMEIISLGKDIRSIRIHMKNLNPVYKSRSLLEYYPGRYYRIKTSEKITIGKEEKLEIKGRFIYR